MESRSGGRLSAPSSASARGVARRRTHRPAADGQSPQRSEEGSRVASPPYSGRSSRGGPALRLWLKADVYLFRRIAARQKRLLPAAAVTTAEDRGARDPQLLSSRSRQAPARAGATRSYSASSGTRPRSATQRASAASSSSSFERPLPPQESRAEASLDPRLRRHFAQSKCFLRSAPASRSDGRRR